MVTGTKLSKDLPRTAKDSTHFAMHAPPTPSEFDETTSLLPCQCFTSFWHKSLASATLFHASSVAQNCWTWDFCVQEDIPESTQHVKEINWQRE